MTGFARQFTPAELLADGVIHVIGIAASLVAVSVMLALALPRIDPLSGAGLAVYGATLIVMFVASAAYNMIPHLHWKPALRRCDQAAIFLKIAGTYTPLVVILSGLFAYGVLAAIWIAAIAGGLAKLIYGIRFERMSVAFYLALGWASVLLAWPIFVTLPLATSVLLLVGGLLYTAGVVFHLWDRLMFQNAIWHAFVLMASACHFVAISFASMTVAS